MFPLLTILAEIGSATLSSPITDSEARKLPYVQAVIKEGLRIFPPITSFISKTAPATGDTVKNVHIPPGTTIGWSAFVVLRSEEIWGLDANFFRPERWLEGSPAERQRKEQEVEMCFGYGKYQCLGKNIAYIELKKIYVEVRYFLFFCMYFFSSLFFSFFIFFFQVGRIMIERALKIIVMMTDCGSD